MGGAQVQQEGQVAVDAARTKFELDLQHQHRAVVVTGGRPCAGAEDPVARDDVHRRQRAVEFQPQHLAQLGDHRVQDHVADLGHRLLLHLGQMLQAKFVADHHPHQLQAVALGEHQDGFGTDLAAVGLTHRAQRLDRPAGDLAAGVGRRADMDARHRQQHLLLHHLAQHIGRRPDADIEDFDQRIALQVGHAVLHGGLRPERSGSPGRVSCR
mmetsp:Transcript_1042/g.1576  ORF Transcript_1042/g.1576 Transcript_1042/m.1576 type:complete len:212 (+) Transcript_1042:753-1388(+)